MKGVVLAGGTGSRLFPLTKITNKHLLPIYDRPMIYYPIQALVDAGIREILIVTGGRNSGDFLRLLANGKQFGLKHINYTYQEGEGGIADALALAEHFADGQQICVVLGDNIIEGSILAAADRFRAQSEGAHILLKEVTDAERFGVAEISGEKRFACPTTRETDASNLPYPCCNFSLPAPPLLRAARPISRIRYFTLRLRSRSLAPTSPAMAAIRFIARVSTRTPSPSKLLSVG